jgi:hypothetical protein
MVCSVILGLKSETGLGLNTVLLYRRMTDKYEFLILFI